MKKKTIQFAIGLAVTVVALWLSFRDIDGDTLISSFEKLNFFWVALAVGNVLLSVFIGGWRWQVLLKSRIPITLGEIFRFNIIGQYVNIVIPARFGELLRAWLVSKHHKLSGSYALATIVIEKMVEMLIVAGFALLVPVFFTFKAQLKGQTVVLAAFAVFIPALVLAIWKREWVMRVLASIAGIFPQRIKGKLLHFLEKAMEAFVMLKSFAMTSRIVSITFLVFLTQVITNLLLFKAFGFKLGIMEALVLQIILLIGMSFPSVPGKLGVFEYTVILALGLLGIDGNAALGYGLILHVIAFLPKIILGFVFMSSLNISLRETGEKLGKFEDEVSHESDQGAGQDAGQEVEESEVEE